MGTGVSEGKKNPTLVLFLAGRLICHGAQGSVCLVHTVGVQAVGLDPFTGVALDHEKTQIFTL